MSQKCKNSICTHHKSSLVHDEVVIFIMNVVEERRQKTSTDLLQVIIVRIVTYRDTDFQFDKQQSAVHKQVLGH